MATHWPGFAYISFGALYVVTPSPQNQGPCPRESQVDAQALGTRLWAKGA
eukprot:CAMPEP_0204223300 /NCGR_PEP_ID=MMETSP0361-20130328/82728_1 /ASSEMBLY_ACC=CAM_ASM_000343 /TAXON_ID=268821 /ORGANISM="Scrippsiella Hangoei, Strain SHTV-5" /LENGTH=49 /DNA_ID= /DNA_START= /DNA_END= /DNA_ORIENTATION=